MSLQTRSTCSLWKCRQQVSDAEIVSHGGAPGQTESVLARDERVLGLACSRRSSSLASSCLVAACGVSVMATCVLLRVRLVVRVFDAHQHPLVCVVHVTPEVLIIKIVEVLRHFVVRTDTALRLRATDVRVRGVASGEVDVSEFVAAVALRSHASSCAGRLILVVRSQRKVAAFR